MSKATNCPICEMLAVSHQRVPRTEEVCIPLQLDMLKKFNFTLQNVNLELLLYFSFYLSFLLDNFTPFFKKSITGKNELIGRKKKNFTKQLLQKFFSYGGLRFFSFSFCLIRS